MRWRTVPVLLLTACLLSPAGGVRAQDGAAEPQGTGDADMGASDVPGIDAKPIESEDETPKTVTVLGHDMLPKKGLLEVTADLNVREGPGTNFKRIDGLEKGDRVRAVGKSADGEWIAVSRGGDILGFVYAPVMIPVVDGLLEEQFFGSFASKDIAGGVACDYRFRFERKTEVEGGDFETADYEIRFRCASQEGAALSYGHMFLTEAPVNERKGLHLIVLDMRSIGDGMEEYLSTSFLYNPKSGEMTFDGHTLPRFAVPPEQQKFQTKSVKDALQQALEAAMSSWTAEAWRTLFDMTRKFQEESQ